MTRVINQDRNHAITRSLNNTYANLMVQIDVAQETNNIFEKNFFGGTDFSKSDVNGNNTSNISFDSLFLPAGCSVPSSSFP
jgi:hypothetical protein